MISFWKGRGRMTYPKTFDSAIHPILASRIPLIVSLNSIYHHFPSHRHDVMEFSLVIEGKGTEWVNGVPHEMVPGTVTLIKPYQFHEISNCGSSPLVLLNCMFGLELLLSASTTEGRDIVDALLPSESTKPYFFHLQHPAHAKMEALFRELHQEFSSDSPFRHTMLKAKLTEILVFMERNRSLEPKQTAPAVKIKPNLASDLLLYLHLHYQDDLSLEQLAAQFYISKTHLSSMFRQTTGRSFVELLHEIRLRHACSLLVVSDLTMADVASESGFHSSKTFFRVFKQYKGITPKEYKNQHTLQLHTKGT
jgi:AraC-like DNA-binding protein/mannose-6-phosphate isomerase-like protein (cupin superfamily)